MTGVSANGSAIFCVPGGSGGSGVLGPRAGAAFCGGCVWGTRFLGIEMGGGVASTGDGSFRLTLADLDLSFSFPFCCTGSSSDSCRGGCRFRVGFVCLVGGGESENERRRGCCADWAGCIGPLLFCAGGRPTDRFGWGGGDADDDW